MADQFDIQELMNMTPEAARLFVASQGVTLNKTQRDALATAQNEIRVQYANALDEECDRIYSAFQQELELENSIPKASASRLERAVEALTTNLPKWLSAIQGVGKVIITTLFTVIVEFGLLLILPLLLFVEITRVAHGVALFESDGGLQTLAAAVLVGANFVLEAVIHHRETVENYRLPRAADFSLRSWANNMAYILGMSRDWKPRLKSPAYRERSVLRVVTFAIIALALAGSMRDELKLQGEDAWYKAFADILTTSNSLTFTTWLTGLIFTLCAVLLAQVLTRYVAARAAETYASLALTSDTSKEDEVMAARIEATRSAVAAREHAAQEQLAADLARLEMEHVIAAIAKANEKAAKAQTTDFLPAPPQLPIPFSNGNGHSS